MKLPAPLHRWNVTPKAAMAIQRDLADRVVKNGPLGKVSLVAGADLAFSTDGSRCVAGVVVWDVVSREVVEQQIAVRPLQFPYVPGLLSFREAPALLAAIGKLRCEPDAFIFDGQGVAHPRRIGLASHVGLLIDRPSVGCAKSRLIGRHDEPASQRGATAPLLDGRERIGTVLRTRDGVRCVYVSVGHRATLAAAVRLVLRCCTRYRLPEPTRLADQLVGRAKHDVR
ncbi:MAG TPA: deoxyribonuclease V [Phycisphaerae bacterium]|nr:deoxyribonuclease V [Phycisphaerae bacterium]